MSETIKDFIKPFRTFIKTKISGGSILLICVLFSLIAMNTSWRDGFHHFFETQIGLSFGSIEFKHDLHFWINDGLMAIFFLLVGLEIKRELLEGELSDRKKSSLPMMAALGGMLVPALFYTIINLNSEGIKGWGIPMATDIAFALAVLSMLGKRIPLSLKIFLTALAIVDDLGAIIVIAIFYTQTLHWEFIFYAFLVMIALYGLNISRVKSLSIYLPFGILLWYFIYCSGVHATISGVLLAFMIPTNKGNRISPLERLEHVLNKPVSYFIMPLFALSNTNIIFDSNSFAALGSSVGTGILCGLILGKVSGITLFSYLSVKFKLSELPKDLNWRHITGAGFLGGIGFTMSIFIALLSFSDHELRNISKMAILIASVCSGLIGYIILKTVKNSEDNINESTEG